MVLFCSICHFHIFHDSCVWCILSAVYHHLFLKWVQIVITKKWKPLCDLVYFISRVLILGALHWQASSICYTPYGCNKLWSYIMAMFQLHWNVVKNYSFCIYTSLSSSSEWPVISHESKIQKYLKNKDKLLLLLWLVLYPAHVLTPRRDRQVRESVA